MALPKMADGPLVFLVCFRVMCVQIYVESFSEE